jgi:hypothetical protein
MEITIAFTIIAYIVQAAVLGNFFTGLWSHFTEGMFRGPSGVFGSLRNRSLTLRLAIVAGGMIALNAVLLWQTHSAIPWLRHELKPFGHLNWTTIYLGSIAGFVHYAYSKVVGVILGRGRTHALQMYHQNAGLYL